MTADQQLTYLREQAASRLSEGGIEAFVLVGYLRLENGALQRVCLANTGKNPAFEDGLRPVIQFSHMWGASPVAFNPDQNGDPKPPTNEG